MSSIIACAGERPCRDMLSSSLSLMSAEKFELCGIALKTDSKIEIAKISGSPSLLPENAKELDGDGRLGLGEACAVGRCKPSGIAAPPASNEHFCAALDGEIENFNFLSSKIKNNPPAATDEALLISLLTRLGDMPYLRMILSVREAVKGSPSFAFIPIDKKAVYAAAGKNPLYAGAYDGGKFISSELSVLLMYTNKYAVVQNGECVKITPDKITVYDENLKKIKKPFASFRGSGGLSPAFFAVKPPSYLPLAVNETVKNFIKGSELNFDSLSFTQRAISKTDRIIITGSGASYRSGLLGAYFIEMFCDIPACAAESGELEHSGCVFDKYTLLAALSAGGEDKKALACVKRAEKFRAKTMYAGENALSSLGEACRMKLVTGSRGGSSLSSYVTGGLALCLFSLWLGNKNGIISDMYLNVALKFAELLPGKISDAMRENSRTQSSAELILGAKSIFVSGTGADFALSAEAAALIEERLKIKASFCSCPSLFETGRELLQDSLAVFLISNPKNAPEALACARRARSLFAKTLIFTTSNIENEINGFDNIISVSDSLPVFDAFAVLAALEKTLERAERIAKEELSMEAG